MEKVVALISESPSEVKAAMSMIQTRRKFLSKYLKDTLKEMDKKKEEIKDLDEKDWTTLKEWLKTNGKLPEGLDPDVTIGFSMNNNTIYYDVDEEKGESDCGGCEGCGDGSPEGRVKVKAIEIPKELGRLFESIFKKYSDKKED